MHKIRKAFALVSLLLLLFSLALSAQAEALDPARLGSLKVRIVETKTKQPVPGGEVEIYLVAQADPVAVAYVLTSDFRSSGFDVAAIGDLSASQNIAQAAKLESFAASHRLKPLGSATPNRNGTVEFKDLPLGLYLVVQSEAPSKHEAIDSFLITVPQRDGDSYVYDVDAAPKTGTSDTVPTTAPTTAPTRPHSGGLPQTGQLWWPVYLLTFAGAALFLLGLYRRKRATHE